MIEDPNQRAAYDKAISLDANYVRNKRFRLMFLRGEEYDTKKAAMRILSHFRIKSEFFSETLLARDIKLKDLSDDDREALYAGSFQFLGVRDVKLSVP